MNIILLSGGSGKRLWPLSDEIRPKQFIPFFEREDGTYESMLQRVYRQILAVSPHANILIATNERHLSQIKEQIGADVSICIEPSLRDTFPAIALATAFFQKNKNLTPSDTVVVCPIDHFVEEDYFESIMNLFEFSHNNKANLSLMGVVPTYPSEKYGYIIPKSAETYSIVSEFKEKPDEKTAQSYIEIGALWNCGIFAFQVGYLSEKAEKLLGYRIFDDLLEHYNSFQKISFDYAVVEHEAAIEVLRFEGNWKDVGTWNTLTEAIQNPFIGNVVDGGQNVNTHIFNELNLPIIAMNLQNLVISASEKGILIAEKEASSHMKPFVDNLDQC